MIDVRDLQMYFEVHGSGPPMLNITGTGNDLRRSAPALNPLNKHFTVLHYDQRGLGQTSAGKANPSMADFADDAAALIAAQGWNSCHVVGTSFGGMVAQHLAIRSPGLIQRLVLNCTSPGGTRPSYPLHELGGLPIEARTDAKFALFDERYDASAAEPIPGLGSIFELLRQEMMTEPDPEAAAGLAQQLEARRHHDVEDALEAVSTETLVCAGRFDLIAPVANSQAIVDRIRNGVLREFEGGHLFMLQDRTAMPAIAAFLLTEG